MYIQIPPRCTCRNTDHNHTIPCFRPATHEGKTLCPHCAYGTGSCIDAQQESEGPGESEYIDVVFDGPPGPDGIRFIEVEDESGCSISAGEWIERSDGFWALRLPIRR